MAALTAACKVTVLPKLPPSPSPTPMPADGAPSEDDAAGDAAAQPDDGFVKKTGDEAMKDFEKKPGFPEAPHRTASFSDKFKNESVFSVGVKTGGLGVEVGATTMVKFALSWESTLTLVRTTKDETEQLVLGEADGDATLNYVEGVDFVGLCSFQASAAGGIGLVGTINIFGNGVTNTTEIEKSLTANETSAFFAIGPDDNLHELRERCLTTFRDKVKASVTKDLQVLIANNAYLSGDGQQQSGEQKAVQAALKGPELKGVGAFGSEWNVKPAKIEKSGETIHVSGQLSHHKPLVADDQIYYTIEISKGQITKATYEGAEGDGDWEQAARKLADLIANEAYLEHAGD
jgi:hypothetical protein